MSLECHRCRRGAGKVQRVKAGLGCYVGGVAIYRGLCEESFVVERNLKQLGRGKAVDLRRELALRLDMDVCRVQREGKDWL